MELAKPMDRKNVQEILRKSEPLRVGFIPMADCAPIVVAREYGLFEKYDLRVELRRETRWADIRDKIIRGELDVAHAPAALPFIANLGLDSDRCACVSGLVLSLQGNAITISRRLWERGARDAASLRQVIYRDWGRRTYTFGVVFPHSTQYFLLRQWLASGGIFPDRHIRLVVVPPAQMFPMLKLGYIDGCCVGEPWTTLAIESEIGVRVTGSAELAPLHPEKVLMARLDFARGRANEHERLLAALLEACAFCDRPENRPALGDLLSAPHYVNAPAECLKHGAETAIFHGRNANEPSEEKAAWVINRLYELMENRLLQIPSIPRTPMLKNIFRRDIFQRARAAAAREARALNAEVAGYEAGAQQA